MGTKRGFRLVLGEPLWSDLIDFCKASYDLPKTRVVRQALREHIDRSLSENPSLRARYETARRDRLEGAATDKADDPGRAK